MKIYVSLPITGRPLETAKQHADAVKMALSRKGHQVVTPFDVYSGKNPDYFDYICYDLRTMFDCDGVIFCTGWEQSCECGIEHDAIMRMKAYDKKDYKIMYE